MRGRKKIEKEGRRGGRRQERMDGTFISAVQAHKLSLPKMFSTLEKLVRAKVLLAASLSAALTSVIVGLESEL